MSEADWEERFSKQHQRPYYYNLVTEKSEWVDPRPALRAAAAAAAAPAVSASQPATATSTSGEESRKHARHEETTAADVVTSSYKPHVSGVAADTKGMWTREDIQVNVTPANEGPQEGEIAPLPAKTSAAPFLGAEYDLRDEIAFLQYYLIPSFNPIYGLTDQNQRLEFIKESASSRWNEAVGSTLIWLYSKIGTVEEAMQVLERKELLQAEQDKLRLEKQRIELEIQKEKNKQQELAKLAVAPVVLPKRTGTVHFSRSKHNVEFRTYNDLEREIESHPKWSKVFRFADFEIKHDNGKIQRPFPKDLDDVPLENVKIVVVLQQKGFSRLAVEPGFALNSIGVTHLKEVMSIPVKAECFPVSSISEEILQQETTKVLVNLEDRRDVISRQLASEYTMREFISPVLIGALKAVIAHDKSKFGDGKLLMVCEKRIIGKRAVGPVDYSFLFDCLDLVLTEAKKDDLHRGIVQNFLQQRASQEFLANTLIDLDIIQEERKRKFAEAFGDIVRTPSCGITSTGSKWVFSRTVYSRDSKSGEEYTDVFVSDTVEMDLSKPNPEILKSLLSRIAQLVIEQAEYLSVNEALITRRRRVFKNATNPLLALQQIEHDRAEEIDLIMNLANEADEGDQDDN